MGIVERLDPAIDALVPRDAQMEIIAEGLEWSEGPVWMRSDGGFLLFSDVLTNTIHRWDAKNGHRRFLTPSGYTGDVPRGAEMGSNGLNVDRQGRLLLCQHGDRRVARLDSLGLPRQKFVTVADRYDGKRFNSPNDLVVHSSGAIYFTDPPFGLEQQMADPAKELPFQGVFRIAPDGTVTLLTKELERPNGIGLSPDEKTLYVANSFPLRLMWMAFPVKEDGSIGEGQKLFDGMHLARKWNRGSADGMAIDVHGNVWATGSGGVIVLSPEGKHLGTLITTQRTANCKFGEDGSTLFIAADDYVLRIRLTTKGIGF
ncbi:MAG: SMP-30/gluconolactonase/LRE family protein [Pirellulales bacterium]